MKHNLESITVNADQEIYADRLKLTAKVAGGKPIPVEVQRNQDGGWKREVKPTTVSLDKNWESKKVLQALGITKADDIIGLRKQALKTAEAYWARFYPSDAESAALKAGELDSCLEVRVRDSEAAVVIFTAVPYAGLKFWGAAMVEVKDGSLANSREPARAFIVDPKPVVNLQKNQFGVEWTNKEMTENRGHYVPSAATKQLVRFLGLAIQNQLAKLTDTIQAKRQAELERDVQNGKEELERANWSLTHAKAALEKAEQALYEHLGGKPTKEVDQETMDRQSQESEKEEQRQKGLA